MYTTLSSLMQPNNCKRNRTDRVPPITGTLAVTYEKFDFIIKVQSLATWSSRGFPSQTVMRLSWQAGNFPLANITSPAIVKLAT